MPAPISPGEEERRFRAGDRIRRARVLNGWTQDHLGYLLAHRGGVQLCRQTIDKIEAGRHRLPHDLVSALEAALLLPAGTLAANDGGLAPGAQVLCLSADAEVPPRLLRFAEQAILRAAHERLTEAAAARRGRSFHSPFTFRAAHPSQEEIEGQADLLRSKWGLGDSPIADLTYSMERQSAVVASIDSDRAGVVYSARVSSFPVLLWHARPPVGLTECADYRLRMLHAMITCLARGRGIAKNDASDRAGKLSRAVLLPKVAMTDALGSRCHQITATNLIALAAQYGIPISAALARVIEVGIIDEQRAEALRRSLNGQQLEGAPEHSRWHNLLPPALQQRGHSGTETRFPEIVPE